MRVLLAFDKFKGALSAGEACRIAADVVARELPDAEIDSAPLTDGGEGFCETLVHRAGGFLEWLPVNDPLGRDVEAPLGWVGGDTLPASPGSSPDLPTDGKWAVVEMAAASGLLLLSRGERDPWKTGSQGTGQLIRHAIGKGADGILLGIGGSATNDGGCGALEALGAAFLNERGEAVERVCPGWFGSIREIRLPRDLPLPRLIIATDVNSPLLGPSGATAVFGPQKGLVDVRKMEEELCRMAGLLRKSSKFPMDPELPGSGAAGGIGYGLSALGPVRWEPGFELVSAWLGLEERLRSADWVLTGEGSLDAGSLSGKGPVAILRSARRLGVSCAVMAGQVDETAGASLRKEIPGLRTVALSDPEWAMEEALEQAARRLAEEVETWCGERR